MFKFHVQGVLYQEWYTTLPDLSKLTVPSYTVGCTGTTTPTH